MKELIPLNPDNKKNPVSARNLYDFLGFNPSQWSRWYKKNIENNPFAIENIDYVGFDIMSNGNITRDFSLTVDFSERISMMAKTEKGEEIRVYFQEVKNKHEKLKEMDEKSGEYLKEIHSPGHEVQEVHKQDHVQAQPQENCLSRSSRLD